MRSMQVRVFAGLIVVGLSAALARSQAGPTTEPASAPAPDRYARELAAACDRLIDLSVKKPYGWGWTESTEQFDAGSSRGNRRAGVMVAMGRQQSPAVGLVLLLSGQFLNEQKYVEAAHEAARGAASSLTKNGQVLR